MLLCVRLAWLRAGRVGDFWRFGEWCLGSKIRGRVEGSWEGFAKGIVGVGKKTKGCLTKSVLPGIKKRG